MFESGSKKPGTSVSISSTIESNAKSGVAPFNKSRFTSRIDIGVQLVLSTVSMAVAGPPVLFVGSAAGDKLAVTVSGSKPIGSVCGLGAPLKKRMILPFNVVVA